MSFSFYYYCKTGLESILVNWGFINFIVRLSSEIWPPLQTAIFSPSVHYDVAFLALLIPDYHVGQVKEMSSVGFANISCWVDGVAKIYDITPYFSPLLTHLKLSLLVCNTFTNKAGGEAIESYHVVREENNTLSYVIQGPQYQGSQILTDQ